ncbi:MAG TPA: Na+/H+ antiporter [Flavobacteriales bacterium]
MLHHDLLLVIGLLFAVSLLTLLGPKLRIAYPILLVLGGLVIAFVPGMPTIHLEPDLIFLVFLPPLLYEAAWFTSWREFWKWRRSIGLLAFNLVFFTSLAVGWFTSWLIPGFTLALGFLLGGIISPPDAVAATSVLKGLRIPKRANTILEGESLVNDASSLIVFRFALAAVITGQFSLQVAIGQFFFLAIGGIVIGVLLANIVYFIHRKLPTTASIDTALTLMTPYLMYIIAEEFHCSGVLSVVSGGLFLSFRSHTFLDYRSRMQANSVWSTVVFMLNGLVFILIGLELPDILEGMDGNTRWQAVGYGVAVSLLIIAIRFLFMYPAAHGPRYASRRIRTREPSPGWRLPTVLGWAGMRGVVSLAAALSIPHTLPNGDPFPHRGTILVITFVVILVTLVGQGLTLPWLVRKLKVEEVDPHVPHDQQELDLRQRLIRAALKQLDASSVDAVMQHTKEQYSAMADRLGLALRDLQHSSIEHGSEHRAAHRAIIQAQRKALADIRRHRIFDDEVVRKVEGQLDLEEARTE